MLSPPFEGTPAVSGVFDHGEAEGQQAWDGTTVTGESGHLGWDWQLRKGTPVLAAADGTVVFSGTEPAFRCPLTGEVVTDQQVVKVLHPLDDGRRLMTGYAHLQRRAVRKGDRVVRGQRLGKAGATGCATGPHLHFSVWRSASGPVSELAPIDPFEAGLWRETPPGTEALAH